MIRRLEVLASATLLATTASAFAQEGCQKFSVHHFLPPKSTAQVGLIEPWAQRIEKATDGCLTFEIYPSMTLGGRPPQLYGQVRDGIVDVAWTVAGYTPGAFPSLEVFELPTVHNNDAVATNRAIQVLFDEFLAAELSDVKPILIHAAAGLQPFTNGVDLNSIEDFKGLRLRSPNRTGAWLIEALGAAAVSLPVSEFPSAVSKSVIDGGIINFEVATPLKAHEITNQATLGDGDMTFGTLIYLLVMNKDKFEALPENIQAAIDANSNAAIADWAGQVYNDAEVKGKNNYESGGAAVVNLSGSETDKLIEIANDSVISRWISEVEEKGIDGSLLVQRAREEVANALQ